MKKDEDPGDAVHESMLIFSHWCFLTDYLGNFFQPRKMSDQNCSFLHV